MDKIKLNGYRAIREKLSQRRSTLEQMILSGEQDQTLEACISLSRLSARYHMYDIAIFCNTYLRDYYMLVDPDQTKFNKAIDRIDMFVEMQGVENDARFFYKSISSAFDRCRTITDEIRTRSAMYIEQMESVDPVLKGPMYLHYYYYAKCLDRSINDDYEGQLMYATKGFRYFDYQEVRFDFTRYNLMSHMIDACLSMQMYKECKDYIDAQDSIHIRHDTSAYTLSMCLRARLEMITSDAMTVDIPTRPFKDLDSYASLIKLYQCIVFDLDDADIDLSIYHYKDVTGLGIAVHIARCIIASRKGDSADLEDSMKQVCYRYLKDDTRSRSMIDYIIKGRPPQEIYETSWNPAIEVIPYEVLLKKIHIESVSR